MSDPKRTSSPNTVICGKWIPIIDDNTKAEICASHPVLLVSPCFFFISLLFVALLSYSAGTMYKTQFVTLLNSRLALTSMGSAFLTTQEFLRSTARHQRSLVKVVNSTCEETQCPAYQELILDEIFFAKGYRQYGGEALSEADDRNGPFAFQVMMDFQRLDADFLADQSRIRDAIMDTIWEVSLDLDLAILSLHCQKLVAVTCVAVLTGGSHMIVATDPENLSCSVDLYSADMRNHLLDAVPILEAYFGVGDKKRTLFRHALRAVFEYQGTTFEHDLSEFLLHEKDRNFYKKEIGSTETDFQEIHVWETLHTSLQSVDSYERSQEAGADNYYTKHPELFAPNRLLFMDGVMQSTLKGDEAYHEALVHPAMFAHSHGPRRAAIVGGGEGATLREILKHKSVEVCMMIEIDPGIVQAARDWLPKMNNCSDFGSDSCFDDERTDLRCEDAFGWFVNRFNTDGDVPEELKTDPFDVIVMDALDPEDNVTFAVQLYQDKHFWRTMNEALTENGILVVQLGMTPRSAAYGEQFGINKNRASLFQTIEAVGFQHVFIYHDIHSDFKYGWSYLAACKSEACVKEWNRNEAQVNLRIRERLLPTKSGESSLKYFDGATMQDFQRPYKSWEIAHCRQSPEPEECSIFRNLNGVTSWSDAFERGSGEVETTLIAKMNLSKGSVIYHNTYSNIPASSFSRQALVATTFGEIATFFGQKTTTGRASCGVTKKLLDTSWSRKISPLHSRHPHMLDLEVLTRDVEKGERVIC